MSPSPHLGLFHLNHPLTFPFAIHQWFTYPVKVSPPGVFGSVYVGEHFGSLVRSGQESGMLSIMSCMKHERVIQPQTVNSTNLWLNPVFRDPAQVIPATQPEVTSPSWMTPCRCYPANSRVDFQSYFLWFPSPFDVKAYLSKHIGGTLPSGSQSAIHEMI